MQITTPIDIGIKKLRRLPGFPDSRRSQFILLFKFRMLRRYKKIEEDSRYSAAEDRGQYLQKTTRTQVRANVFYLLLSTSISLYLQSKWNLRKLNTFISYPRARFAGINSSSTDFTPLKCPLSNDAMCTIFIFFIVFGSYHFIW